MSKHTINCASVKGFEECDCSFAEKNKLTKELAEQIKITLDKYLTEYKERMKNDQNSAINVEKYLQDKYANLMADHIINGIVSGLATKLKEVEEHE